MKEKAAQGKVLKDGAGLEKGCSLVCGSQPVPWHWGGSADGFGEVGKVGRGHHGGLWQGCNGSQKYVFLSGFFHTPLLPLGPGPQTFYSVLSPGAPELVAEPTSG